MFPFLHHRKHLLPSILTDGIHLDIILIIAKWILELTADAFNAVQGESDERNDWDRPPCELVDSGEGE